MLQMSYNQRFSLPVLFTCLTLFVCAAGAFGVIAMRQRIASVAEQTKAVEQAVAKLERKHQYFTARIAEIHQPVYLKNRIAGVLNMPDESQVIWADVPSTHTAMQVASKKPVQLEPLVFSLDLAFLATATR